MSVLLISHNTPQKIELAAHERGFCVVRMPEMGDMTQHVSSHPDMLLSELFGRLFVREAHMKDTSFSHAVYEILSLCPALTLTVTSDTPADRYPDDVAFNCAIIGGALAGRADTISSSVKRAASESMIPTLNVAQGYTKCATCVMGSDMRSPIITADKSVYTFAVSRGVSAYLISPGGVCLPGYNTGFIGGASFFADGTIYFLGNIDLHPDRDKIRSAADAHGVHIVSLSDEPLFDAGCLYIE